jgi:hypothetical protein
MQSIFGKENIWGCFLGVCLEKITFLRKRNVASLSLLWSLLSLYPFFSAFECSCDIQIQQPILCAEVKSVRTKSQYVRMGE